MRRLAAKRGEAAGGSGKKGAFYFNSLYFRLFISIHYKKKAPASRKLVVKKIKPR
jgi:hypothetical protein